MYLKVTKCYHKSEKVGAQYGGGVAVSERCKGAVEGFGTKTSECLQC